MSSFRKMIMLIIHPSLLFNKIKWEAQKRKLGSCGKNSRLGEGFRVIGAENIFLGNDVEGGRFVSLCTWKHEVSISRVDSCHPRITIGNNVHITEFSYISCLNEVNIGDGTLIGVNTFITDNYHGKSTKEEMNIPPHERTLYSSGSVTIGKNVWTGRNVCILPNVTIGDGAIIGANSVVTHDIPANCIAVGAPAHIIREVFD